MTKISENLCLKELHVGISRESRRRGGRLDCWIDQCPVGIYCDCSAIVLDREQENLIIEIGEYYYLREGAVSRNFMMIATQDTSNTMMCCASCGTSEGDDIKLKACPTCKSVQYCSITCQENHRPMHVEACNKRAAELRDEILFKQPESSHLGDCPICCLPLSIYPKKSVSHDCCSTTVCNGCIFANTKREMNARLNHTCPFCRDSIVDANGNQKMMKRIQANDPIAMRKMHLKRYREGNFNEALQLLTKAAELGDVDAHYILSLVYRDGEQQYHIEEDEKKEWYHLEEAAIGGHPDARFNLGVYEWNNDRYDRAVKHWIIAANLGCDNSIKQLKDCYKDGDVSKEDFASALRAHKAAVDATKSPQRTAAEAVEDRL